MTRKKLLIVLGAALSFLVVLTGLESLVPREPAKPRKPSGAFGAPIRPTLERPEPKIIVVEGGEFHRSRFLFDDDDSIEEVDAIYDCLEEGIRREFDANPATRRSEVRSRLKSIQDDCVFKIENLPILPPPPSD
jgi:hypothetical protein